MRIFLDLKYGSRYFCSSLKMLAYSGWRVGGVYWGFRERSLPIEAEEGVGSSPEFDCEVKGSCCLDTCCDSTCQNNTFKVCTVRK